MAYLPTLFAVIASFSILSNVTVCVLFLYNKSWLKKPYNLFILSLAITDTMTGILMFLTPGMIFEEVFKTPNNVFFGNLYCRVLWSRYILFALGAVSVYTCLVLTIERWTAICQPFKYRSKFTSKRLICYIVVVWIVGLLVSPMAGIEAVHHPKTTNVTAPWCSMSSIMTGSLIGVFTIISVMAKFFIPSAIILALYVVAMVNLRKCVRSQRQEIIQNVTKTASVACIALVVCWMPNQIYFVLHKFRKAELFTDFHNATSLIVFLNSTLNPFIYAFWGKHYRAGFKKLFCRWAKNSSGTKTGSHGVRGIYRSNNGEVSMQDNNGYAVTGNTIM